MDAPKDAGSAEPLQTVGTVCLLIWGKRENFFTCEEDSSISLGRNREWYGCCMGVLTGVQECIWS